MPVQKSSHQRKASTTERRWGPFITQLLHHKEGAGVMLRSSRRFRRGMQDLILDRNGSIKQKVGALSLLFSIRPDLLSWWIGTFFMIGASFFIAGSVMQLFLSHDIDVTWINFTYFIGSLFFTSAAYGQLSQSMHANIALRPQSKAHWSRWQWWASALRSPGFVSALSQFIGTLLFNINTFSAFYGFHTPKSEYFFIWIPDMVGSVLFLVSAFFAWIEVWHDAFVKPFVSVTWWVVWFNIIGSVFFQISALYGYLNPLTGTIENATLAVEYTLWGAVCFYLGAHFSNVEIREIGRKKAGIKRDLKE